VPQVLIQTVLMLSHRNQRGSMTYSKELSQVKPGVSIAKWLVARMSTSLISKWTLIKILVSLIVLDVTVIWKHFVEITNLSVTIVAVIRRHRNECESRNYLSSLLFT